MTHRRRAARVYTKTVSSTIAEETWERLQAHAPWSAFIRDAIQEKLDRTDIMRECADELQEWVDTMVKKKRADVTDLIATIAKLRGQSQ